MFSNKTLLSIEEHVNNVKEYVSRLCKKEIPSNLVDEVKKSIIEAYIKGFGGIGYCISLKEVEGRICIVYKVFILSIEREEILSKPSHILFLVSKTYPLDEVIKLNQFIKEISNIPGSEQVALILDISSIKYLGVLYEGKTSCNQLTIIYFNPEELVDNEYE